MSTIEGRDEVISYMPLNRGQVTGVITASAPGRCGIVGNPTDMYGGCVISCSTRERAYCSLYRSGRELVISVSDERQVLHTREDLKLRGDKLDVVKAVLTFLEVDPEKVAPFELWARTDILMQAGLAGSTAILTAIVGCVAEYLKMNLNPYETAEMVRRIEFEVLNIICGYQDQYMASFGGLNFMTFTGKHPRLEPGEPAPYATVEALHSTIRSLPVILANTGVKHHSGAVHKSIRERWLEGEQTVVDAYTQIAQFAEMGKIAILHRDWERLATLMNCNHALQRDLGGSGESNERLIDAAIRGGAIGAKLAGAGGGGTIIALTLTPRETEAALRKAGVSAILYPRPSSGLKVTRN